MSRAAIVAATVAALAFWTLAVWLMVATHALGVPL